jgi:hypothetical protein
MALIFGKKTREVRKREDTPAWIVSEGSFGAIKCNVIDQSAHGAKLTVDNPASVSKHFNLTFSLDSRRGRRCEVKWRKGRTLGIEFTDSQDSTGFGKSRGR